MTWVLEMTGTRISDGVAERFLFALGAGLALKDDDYVEPGLIGWASPSQNIDVAKTGGVSTKTDAGEFTISNAPPAIDQPGPWDRLLDVVWNGKTATLFWVPGQLWSQRVKMAWGTMEQPIGSILGSGSQPNIKFPLRDPRAALEAPLQPKKFLGDNAGPVGVEGGSDLKGTPKPILYGTASNCPVPKVNDALLIYQVADKPVSVLCVRDGASALTAGVVRANLASMQATPPGGGKYDVYAGAEGTFVRVGTTPTYGLAVDAAEGANAAARTHAKIWSRIRTERCGTAGGDINTSSITAADLLDAGEVGFWWSGETTQREAVDQVLASFNGFEINEVSGQWKVQKLVLPSGTPVIELAVLRPNSVKTAKARSMTALQRLRPGYAPNGVPPYRVTVYWGRNYKVMNDGEFAGYANTRLKEKFSTEWRLEPATNATVWNPDTGAGLWPNAPELTVESSYIPGPDGLTCPAATAEAARLLAMYSTLRGQYQVSFNPRVEDRVQPGDVVKLTHASMGLSGGKLFVVLQAGLLVGSKGSEMDLVVGLEA
ncbi:hypothetical protein CPT_Sansa38 [Caulobacter phage Sansa]|uniref:Tail protein n=1 Tax=Caulobacter phage Sansa TaxID=1675600 RepID=A0A0K1LLR0_9CAUD|nr:hypothetical protein HOR07_gp038 [Caulobacter phage Sansa]AKU43442.1 hypothetical protein CPT_Sansa38 [Caulobacter phage Sansa]